MSNIVYSNIDINFPVPGIDNDSSGFRNNFASIQTALNTAKTEITELQTKSVLTAALGSTPAISENDLNGSSIENGYYVNFSGKAWVDTVSIPTDISILNGDAQHFILTDDVNFTFRDWPENARFSRVRVHFLNDEVDTWQPSLYTEGGGTIIYDSEFPVPFKTEIVDGACVPRVIEAWTYDAGATVYVKYLGEFATGSNNRSISGNLTVSGTTTLAASTATGLTVSGTTTLQGSVSANTLSVTSAATFNSAVTVKGNTTLGDDKTADTVTFTSIPVFPSFTTTERNTITAVAGMVILNTTTTKLQVCTVPGVGVAATWADLN